MFMYYCALWKPGKCFKNHPQWILIDGCFSKNTWLYEQWLTYISGWIWFICALQTASFYLLPLDFFLLRKRFSIYVTNRIWVKLRHYEMSINNIRVLYRYYILRAIFMIFQHTKTWNKRSTKYAWGLNI